jgi:hypothetical protein
MLPDCDLIMNDILFDNKESQLHEDTSQLKSNGVCNLPTHLSAPTSWINAAGFNFAST